MSRSSTVLVIVLAAAFLAFISFGVATSDTSPAVLAVMAVFGLVLVLVAFVALTAKRKQPPVAGRLSLPRIIWVLFASYAAAIGLAMLLAVLALPWAGVQGFEYFLGPEHSWALLVLGVVLVPFVQRRLR
jgi:hypothetical protein